MEFAIFGDEGSNISENIYVTRLRGIKTLHYDLHFIV